MKNLLNLCCFCPSEKQKHTPTKNHLNLNLNVYLPKEITENILLKLPIKSLFRFKCMCKTWCSIIDSPHFSDMYFPSPTSQFANPSSFILFPRHSEDNPYIIEDHHDDGGRIADPLKIILPFSSHNTSVFLAGSSNGILCLSSFDSCCRHRNIHFPTSNYVNNPIQSNYSVGLWNPTTREYVQLPKPILPNCGCLFISSGFDYSPSSNEFKVVQLFYYYDPDVSHSRAEIQICTTRLSSWRKIQGDPLSLFEIPCFARGSPVFLNGLFHWLNFTAEGFIQIVSFDMGCESFKDFPCPKPSLRCLNTVRYSPFHLGVLGGCLSISDSSSAEHHEVWVMKDYNVEESWMKQFVLTRNFMNGVYVNIIHPVSFRGNIELVLLCDFKWLVCYNWETGKLRPLEDNKLPKYDFKATLYVKNLISLNSVGRKEMNQTFKGKMMISM